MICSSLLTTSTIFVLAFSSFAYSFFIPPPPSPKVPYAEALRENKRTGLPTVPPINSRMSAKDIGSCMYMLGEAAKLESGFGAAYQFYKNAYLISGGHNFPDDAVQKVAEMTKLNPQGMLNNAKNCLWMLEAGYVRLLQLPIGKTQLQCLQVRVMSRDQHAARYVLDTIMLMRGLGLNYAYAQDILMNNLNSARQQWQKMKPEQQQALVNKFIQCDTNTEFVTTVATVAYQRLDGDPLARGGDRNTGRTYAVRALAEWPQQRQNLICAYNQHQWNTLNLLPSQEFKNISAELNKVHPKSELNKTFSWLINMGESLLPETKQLFAQLCKST